MKKSFFIYIIALLIVTGIFGYLVWSRNSLEFKKGNNSNVANKANVSNQAKIDNNQNKNAENNLQIYTNDKLGFRVALPEVFGSQKEYQGILSTGGTEEVVAFLLKNSVGEDYFLKDPFFINVRITDSKNKSAVEWAADSLQGQREIEGYGETSKVIQTERVTLNNVDCIKQYEESTEKATTSYFSKNVYCIKNDKLYLIEGISKNKADFSPYEKYFDEFVSNFSFAD